jgi:hypothetical protein
VLFRSWIDVDDVPAYGRAERLFARPLRAAAG